MKYRLVLLFQSLPPRDRELFKDELVEALDAILQEDQAAYGDDRARSRRPAPPPRPDPGPSPQPD